MSGFNQKPSQNYVNHAAFPASSAPSAEAQKDFVRAWNTHSVEIRAARRATGGDIGKIVFLETPAAHPVDDSLSQPRQ